ncbi:MAG: hypothetical protein K1X79_07845 [Oligoflexia bacterium]|nr:hypothetical protein [Oligoflexia bacterium]
MGLVLGKSVPYPDKPDSSILYRVPRKPNPVSSLVGHDDWKCYEFSWLDSLGLPKQGILWLRFSTLCPYLVESKSLKLYLGGYFNTRFPNTHEIQSQISNHLEQLLGLAPEQVRIYQPQEWSCFDCHSNYNNLVPIEDRLTVAAPASSKIRSLNKVTEERLGSNALRSLCPITEQPDWGSIEIHYRGRQIDQSSLIGWLLDKRSSSGFHEQIADELAAELITACEPNFLCMSAFFVRRGGIDITPVRYTKGYQAPEMVRHIRQ